jgi:hypothetical protein
VYCANVEVDSGIYDVDKIDVTLSTDETVVGSNDSANVVVAGDTYDEVRDEVTLTEEEVV